MDDRRARFAAVSAGVMVARSVSIAGGPGGVGDEGGAGGSKQV